MSGRQKGYGNYGGYTGDTWAEIKDNAKRLDDEARQQTRAMIVELVDLIGYDETGKAIDDLRLDSLSPCAARDAIEQYIMKFEKGK